MCSELSRKAKAFLEVFSWNEIMGRGDEKLENEKKKKGKTFRSGFGPRHKLYIELATL